MRIENTRDHYGAVAIALHWIMAVLLVVLLAMGLYMVRIPDAGFDKLKINLIVYHKEIGILVLLLMLLRWAWRFVNGLPVLVASLPDWQKLSARFVHLCFYALMLALPMTGWLMSSAAGFPVPFLGIYLPDLVGYDDHLFHVLADVHKWLAYALIPLIAIHMGAALWHHFVERDATLKKMLPASGD